MNAVCELNDFSAIFVPHTPIVDRNTPLHIIEEKTTMSVARVTEIIASSPKSFGDAFENGVERASQTLKNVQSAWIKDEKAVIEDGKIVEYRVNMKVTFILKD